MRITSLLFSLLWLIILSACEQDVPDNGNEKKFLVSRIYDTETLDAEVRYLSTIDTDKLSQIEKLGVLVRMEELSKARDILKNSTSVVINISQCIPNEPRIPPPGPCPVIEDLLETIPTGTHINLDLLGVYMDIPEIPEVRIAEEQSGMQLISKDGKELFAYGSLNSYDKLFHTAWYQFDVKNPALAGKELILEINTVIISKQQVKNWRMEIAVPAGTFLAD